MTTAKPAASEASRTDADKDKNKPDAVAASRTDVKAEQPTTDADKSAPVTRSDVEAMIAASADATVFAVTKAVTEALAAQRGDKAGGDKAPETADTQRSDTPPAEPTLADVMRSVAALTEQVTGIKAEVAAFEGGTVVRSDGGEPKQATPESKDVFRGVFGKR